MFFCNLITKEFDDFVAWEAWEHGNCLDQHAGENISDVTQAEIIFMVNVFKFYSHCVLKNSFLSKKYKYKINTKVRSVFGKNCICGWHKPPKCSLRNIIDYQLSTNEVCIRLLYWHVFPEVRG